MDAPDKKWWQTIPENVIGPLLCSEMAFSMHNLLPHGLWLISKNTFHLTKYLTHFSLSNRIFRQFLYEVKWPFSEGHRMKWMYCHASFTTTEKYTQIRAHTDILSDLSINKIFPSEVLPWHFSRVWFPSIHFLKNWSSLKLEQKFNRIKFKIVLKTILDPALGYKNH